MSLSRMRDELTSGTAAELSRMGIDSYVADGVARMARWPTVAVRVGGVTDVRKKPDALLVHAELSFAYNPDRPNPVLRTCATGVGPDPASAVRDAAKVWVRSWAPPLFSVLHSAPILDAEWFPSTDPQGIPGWDAFSSNYVLRGASSDSGALATVLEQNPPLDLVRTDLAQRLDPVELLHTLSLFIGRSGVSSFAEVQIDGEIQRDLEPRLARFPTWPGNDWSTVYQCLVLINPRPADG